jgi:hypothetical protein
MHILDPTAKFTSLCVMVWEAIGIGDKSPLLILTESVRARFTSTFSDSLFLIVIGLSDPDNGF